MRTSLLLACLALLGGCDLVFRLDHIADPGVDAEVHGTPATVVGTFERHLVTLDASDRPILGTTTVPPGRISAKVSFTDGTTIPVMVDTSGAFSFDWPDDARPYTLTIVTELSTQTFQLSNKQLLLVERIGGRAARKPVSPDTTVHLTVSPVPASTVTIDLVSTGMWTTHAIDPMTYTTPFAWKDVTSLSGPVGLPEAALDNFYYLEYASVGVYSRLARFEIERLASLSDATNNGLTFNALQAPANNQCALLMPEARDEIERLKTFTSDVTATGDTWGVNVTPALEMLPETAFPLAYHVDPSEPGGDAAPAQMLAYTDPFAGEVEVGALVVQVAGNPSLETSVSTQLAGGCAATTLASGAVKVPTQIKLAGHLLTTKDQTIAIMRAKPVFLSWTPSESGDAHYYVIKLIEANGTQPIERASFITVTPRVIIDSTLLAAGSSYTFSIETRIGLPNASTGDYATTGAVVGRGRAVTTTFQVE